jgi:hypothetical protein
VAVAPPTARDKNLITKPTSPMTPMPSTLIFTDSQSSVLPGFTANFKVLAAWDNHDLMPIFTDTHIQLRNNKRYCDFLRLKM